MQDGEVGRDLDDRCQHVLINCNLAINEYFIFEEEFIALKRPQYAEEIEKSRI